MVHNTRGGSKIKVKVKQDIKPNTFEQHHSPVTLKHQCTNVTHPTPNYSSSQQLLYLLAMAKASLDPD